MCNGSGTREGVRRAACQRPIHTPSFPPPPQDLLDHDFLHPERAVPAPPPAISTVTAALGVTEEQLKTIVSQVMSTCVWAFADV